MIDASMIQFALGLVVAVLGYLLRQKDEKQEELIKSLTTKQENDVALLWQKHDQDAKDLSELRLHIASQHYVKTELDARFDKMELAFAQGFEALGKKLDKIVDTLNHKD